MSESRVAVVDYGMGNLYSVRQACEAVGLQAVITSDRGQIEGADGVILPGVGAFGQAMQRLHDLGLCEVLARLVAQERPFLGICLGLQLLFEESEEFGVHAGLGLVPGRVANLRQCPELADGVKIPFVGWQPVAAAEDAAFAAPDYYYFVHSYYVVPADPAVVAWQTRNHGLSYCAGIRRGRLLATQFHPERSGKQGLAFLRKFAAMVAAEA